MGGGRRGERGRVSGGTCGKEDVGRRREEERCVNVEVEGRGKEREVRWRKKVNKQRKRKEKPERRKGKIDK